jgi:hypothetical protein
MARGHSPGEFASQLAIHSLADLPPAQSFAPAQDR